MIAGVECTSLQCADEQAAYAVFTADHDDLRNVQWCTATPNLVLTVTLNHETAADIDLGGAYTLALIPAGKTSATRRFVLERLEDVSGVSGTGEVADGVEWPNGQVTICWRGKHASVCVWPCLEDALAIHGHDGATVVRWVDSS